MFDSIGKIFGKGDRLLKLAQSSDRRAFIEALGEANLCVCESLPPATHEETDFNSGLLLADELERVADDPRADGASAPLIYQVGQASRLPIFTDKQRARRFISEYGRESGRVFPFRVLIRRGSELARTISRCDQVVLNDRSDDAYPLTNEDRRLMGELWGKAGGA